MAVLAVCAGAVGQASGTGERGGVPLVVEIVSSPSGASGPGPHATVRVSNRSDRVVVSYGLEFWQRDRRARREPGQTFRIRPRHTLRPGQVSAVPAPLPVTSDLQVQPTFMIFADGTWAGAEWQARREVETLREEYAAVRDIGERLASTTVVTPATLQSLATACSRGLARSRSRGARAQYEWVLRAIGPALERPDRRSAQQTARRVRDWIDRTLAEFAPLTFVTQTTTRG